MPKYKCPYCGGEFDEPATRPKVTIDSNATITAMVSTGVIYVCPFCGRVMEGLTQ